MDNLNRWRHRVRFGCFLAGSMVSRRKYEFLFVLSHMRSGSTLLSHLLYSHKEIGGFGEAHQWYVSPRCLMRLTYQIRRQTGPIKPTTRYLMDKILHNRYTVYIHLAETESIRFIVLLRDPCQSISSMLRFENLECCPLTGRSRRDLEAYYCARVYDICDFVSRLGGRANCLFTSYKDIVGRSEQTLNRMSRFLDLNSPLQTHYEVGPMTGQPVIGDSSPQIFSGRILPPDRTTAPCVEKNDIPRAVEMHADAVRYLSSNPSVES